MKESAIFRQLTAMKKAAEISAEWQDLVSCEEIAEKTRKSIQAVKELLKEKGLDPKAKLGKTYLYSKMEILDRIRI